jgi:hypothetical protein
MPRKSTANLKSADKLIEQAVEDWKGVSVIKYEMAKEAYDAQDAKTQAVIDRIVGTLRSHANGYINVQLTPPSGGLVAVKIDNEYLMMNLLYLALEVVKDLAIVGTRVATFKFPPSLCAACGAEVIPEKRTGKKVGR